ncbi:MAG: hypothetical protein ACFNXU_03845 [Kingella sp. (in: b-proteobacteria)]
MAFITQYLILFREIPKKANKREYIELNQPTHAYCEKSSLKNIKPPFPLNTPATEPP